jgi:hypothetical protein
VRFSGATPLGAAWNHAYCLEFKPSFSQCHPNAGISVSENTELLLESLRVALQEPATKNGPITEQEFDQLVEKLIFTAMANGILPQDALAALANALGTLSAFAARREGLSVKEVLSASRDSVTTFAMLAEGSMKDNPDFDPYQP